MRMLSPVTVCLLAAGLASLPPCAFAQSVPGETSRTPARPALQWRAGSFQAQRASRLRYRELPLPRIMDVERYNAARRMKPAQIGVGRKLATEGMATTLPALQWQPLKGGGAIARIEITSPDAMAMRVGLRVADLHPDAELRFAGSDQPDRVVAMIDAHQAQLLSDAQGLFWTPSTDGQTQRIEIYRPAHVTAAMAKVGAPQATHLLANSRNDFKIVEKIGESESCNVDTACRVNELGANFSKAKNAVAHMQFVTTGEDGTVGTYICTGTLLSDTVNATQTPYFYSANHCISDQTVASTLNTFWRYEATGCNSGIATTPTQLSGGAAYLYSSATTDALLLRLNDPAPAGAEFIGWDAAALPASSEIIGIHHPSGDVKKVSSGRQVAASSDASLNGVGWLSGTTEGGSSGSGLFTMHADGYRLRGGLLGGSAQCSNSGDLTDVENRDYYSRFDVAFPHIKAWLAPTTPIRRHGAQPLIRGQAAAVSASSAPATPSALAPATTPSAVTLKRRPVIQRRARYRYAP